MVELELVLCHGIDLLLKNILKIKKCNICEIFLVLCIGNYRFKGLRSFINKFKILCRGIWGGNINFQFKNIY